MNGPGFKSLLVHIFCAAILFLGHASSCKSICFLFIAIIFFFFAYLLACCDDFATVSPMLVVRHPDFRQAVLSKQRGLRSCECSLGRIEFPALGSPLEFQTGPDSGLSSWTLTPVLSNPEGRTCFSPSSIGVNRFTAGESPWKETAFACALETQ